MNTEHIKWMETVEIKNIKEYIMSENSGVFVNIKKKVDEYLCEIIRFLILKSIHRDFKPLLLSPLSKEIDDVWHCFLLHTEEYHSFVNKMTLEYCQEAHFIHHNPRGIFEDGLRIERLERTKMVYKSRYNTLPSLIIGLNSPNNKRKREELIDVTEEDHTEEENTFPSVIEAIEESIKFVENPSLIIGLNSPNNKRKQLIKRKKEPQKDVNEEAQTKEKITLRFKYYNGEETDLKIKKSTKFEKVFDLYCQRKGIIDVNAFIFRFEGTTLFGEMTPSDVNMEDGDVIDVYKQQIGC
jgi:small ubiquitin-related modifier